MNQEKVVDTVIKFPEFNDAELVVEPGHTYLYSEGEVLKFKNSEGITEISAAGGGEWGTITGTLSNQTDLNSALTGKANTSHAHTALQGGSSSGTCSFADSCGTASGNYSHADSMGSAQALGSHADSCGTASGNYSHADSGGTVCESFSHADSGGTACGSFSHADSSGTASGYYSHADSGGTASGCYSHADSMGSAQALGSHADSGSVACSNFSHADSGGTACGCYSHADSYGTACGNYSHAVIYGKAVAPNSFASGQGSRSYMQGEVVVASGPLESTIVQNSKIVMVGCDSGGITANGCLWKTPCYSTFTGTFTLAGRSAEGCVDAYTRQVTFCGDTSGCVSLIGNTVIGVDVNQSGGTLSIAASVAAGATICVGAIGNGTGWRWVGVMDGSMISFSNTF